MTGNEINPLLEVFRLVDGFIGLGIALWIIRIGIQRLDTMQAQYRGFVETVLGQQQQNNDELMRLIASLCIPADLPSRLQDSDRPK